MRDQFGHVDRCRTSSCTITGLANGTTYRFSVRAHNAVGFSDWSGPSIGAKPDDPIDLFGRIRLVEAGDQTLKIAWVPVETKGGAQVTYVVRWAGGQLPVTVPRATITGLDNHLQYVFEVVPRNVFTFGTGLRSEPFQPVGKPFTPPPPTLTDQETAGAAGAVTLTWPEVDANGPGPLRYTVYRDNQPIARAPTCSVRVCDNANLTYNGHVYSFAVRATNGGGEVSDLGPATQWRATGKPASWSAWSVLATGNNNQARAGFTVPGLAGGRSRSCGSTSTAPRSTRPPAPEAWTPCSRCPTTSAPTRSRSRSATRTVRAPSRRPRTSRPTARSRPHTSTASRRPSTCARVSWTIEVDSNGHEATLLVTSDRGRSQEFAVPIGVSTFTTNAMEFDYQETETVTVTLSDPSLSRGPVTATNSATTEPPPPPSVVASKGAACNDDAATGLPPCDTGLFGGPKCTDASCAFVHITLSNWRTDVPGTAVFCSVNGEPGRPYDPNVSVDTPDYYGSPGGTVTVRCENVLGQEAQTQFTW